MSDKTYKRIVYPETTLMFIDTPLFEDKKKLLRLVRRSRDGK